MLIGSFNGFVSLLEQLQRLSPELLQSNAAFAPTSFTVLSFLDSSIPLSAIGSGIQMASCMGKCLTSQVVELYTWWEELQVSVFALCSILY